MLGVKIRDTMTENEDEREQRVCLLDNKDLEERQAVLHALFLWCLLPRIYPGQT